VSNPSSHTHITTLFFLPEKIAKMVMLGRSKIENRQRWTFEMRTVLHLLYTLYQQDRAAFGTVFHQLFPIMWEYAATNQYEEWKQRFNSGKKHPHWRAIDRPNWDGVAYQQGELDFFAYWMDQIQHAANAVGVTLTLQAPANHVLLGGNIPANNTVPVWPAPAVPVGSDRTVANGQVVLTTAAAPAAATATSAPTAASASNAPVVASSSRVPAAATASAPEADSDSDDQESDDGDVEMGDGDEDEEDEDDADVSMAESDTIALPAAANPPPAPQQAPPQQAPPPQAPQAPPQRAPPPQVPPQQAQQPDGQQGTFNAGAGWYETGDELRFVDTIFGELSAEDAHLRSRHPEGHWNP
jgi:hypothetical protein